MLAYIFTREVVIKKLTRPGWYDDRFYNKNRTPEEWLFELWKRHAFNQQFCTIHLLSIKEQEKRFLEVIFDTQSDKYLNFVEAIEPQPIRHPSVSDVFLMYHQLTNTDWYQNNSNSEEFENAISAITENRSLSREQQVAFMEMQKTPWCIAYENHQQDNWYPQIEIEHLSGIPILLDQGYDKKDTIAILENKFNAWIGKKKRRQVQDQFDTWQESQILTVFDLKIWFEIQKTKINNIDIHKLIWPDGRVSKVTGEGVNPDDDIRHSIDLTIQIIDCNVISSLIMLCEGRKFKKEMRPV